MADVLGSRLGRYDIRERLGRGGMATVYKGWDTNLDRWVAVKVLHDHLADESDFKQRFEREAKLVAALSHPNIVQIYDFDQALINGQPVYYMVMALINGPTLRDVMEQKHIMGQRLSMDEVSRVIESVCSALAYAHNQGMIHRDVTPSNILFSDQGGVVLADFGLARLASGARLTQTGMTTGTPVYMSPEQGMGMPGDARSDLYSLGVILYEMLSGRAPYEGDSAYAIIMQHVNAPTPPLDVKEASPSLELVVFRALAKDPETRYQTAGEFLNDFQRATKGTLPTAIREGLATMQLLKVAPAPTVIKPKRAASPSVSRLPLFLLAGAVAILAIVGVIALSRSGVDQASGDSGVVVTMGILSTAAPVGGSSMTDDAVPFADDFSTAQHSAWMLDTTNPAISRQYITGPNGVLRIQNTLKATALTTVVNPRVAIYGGPIIIESDMTISTKSQPPSGTGIIFRYRSDDQYYVFAFDAERRVSIWLRNQGTWTELRHELSGIQWTPAAAVNPPGQKNHLKLIVDDSHLQGFINGVSVIDINTDPVIVAGGVGVYLATTSNPNEPTPFAAVDVATYSVQLYLGPATSTPTGNAASTF